MKRREQGLVVFGVVVVGASVWFATSGSGPVSKTKLVPLKQARATTQASQANVRKLQLEQNLVEPHVKARAYNKPAEQLVPIIVGNLQEAAKRAGIHIREVRPL